MKIVLKTVEKNFAKLLLDAKSRIIIIKGRRERNSKNVDNVWIKNTPAEKKEQGERLKRSFRMAAAPYEITANAQNSDALDRLGGSLLENRRYETVSCVER